MPVRSVSELVLTLERLELLEPSRVDMLNRSIQGRFQAPAALAAELIRLGWLTKFQTDLILDSHGDDLVLGPYRLHGLLGEGGVSQVYKAWHVPYQCFVALKVMRPELRKDAESLRNFQQELNVVGKFNHPNVIKGIDIHPERWAHFFGLEYVEGIDLGKLVQKQGALSVGLACDYIRQAALGLQHAFERGVIHRDIKPANLLVTHGQGAPPGGLIKILDLGLARREWATDPTLAVTPMATMVLGTPDFVAPEQATAPEQVDIRADIYSLGCTLFFLITAKPPFPGRSLAQKLMAHQNAAIPSLEQARPGTPAALGPVLRKMMAKKPDERHRTPASVAMSLASFARSEKPS